MASKKEPIEQDITLALRDVRERLSILEKRTIENTKEVIERNTYKISIQDV